MYIVFSQKANVARIHVYVHKPCPLSSFSLLIKSSSLFLSSDSSCIKREREGEREREREGGDRGRERGRERRESGEGERY